MKTHYKAILIACFCLPTMGVQARLIDLPAIATSAYAQPSPTKILQAAAPILGIAFSTLQGLYEDGQCTITHVGGDSYQVKVGGGDTCIVVIVDD